MALSKDELRERWETEDGKERLARVIEAIQGMEELGHILDGFPGTSEVKSGDDLRGVNFVGLNLEKSMLSRTHFQYATFSGVNLKGAHLIRCHFENVSFSKCPLDNAYFTSSHLECAVICGASLKGAMFRLCILDNALFYENKIDNMTDFRGSNLDAARCGNTTRNRLKYSIRRLNWEAWYGGHPGLKWPVKVFWKLTNYGTDQTGLFWAFWMGAILFAAAYLLHPSSISGLSLVDKQEVTGGLLVLRAFYFSVVTMTTLGFGDIYAAPDSPFGHILLIAQVLLGYFLLGALITRLGILFQSEGPTDIKKDEESEKPEEETQEE